MAENSPWKWNYFTLESISKVKCNLCDSVRKPLIRSKVLKEHLQDKQNDEEHKEPFLEFVRMQKKKEFSWDSHYEIVSSNKLFNPYVKCTHCKVFIPIPSDTIQFVRSPTDLSEHLKKAHEIGYSNWKALENWIYGRTRTHHITEILENQVIKVDTCTVCEVEIGAKNAIMFVKHLIEKHRNDAGLNIPWDIIPKELRPSDFTEEWIVRQDNTLSSDIVDRPGPSRQGSLRVSSKPTQFSSKRKKEVSKEMPELLPSSSTVREDTTLSSDIADRPSGQQDRVLLDYDPQDLFEDINTGDSQTENIMEIETSISSNQSMTNVLEDSSQIDAQAPSTQPHDPCDIHSTSGKGTQIPPNKRRKLSSLEIINVRDMLEHADQSIEICKMIKDNSSTDDSE